MLETDKIYMGIDPGSDGFCTFNIGDELHFKHLADFKVGKEWSPLLMLSFFQEFKDLNIHVVLEDVHADGSWTGLTNWSLSRCKAIIETSLAAFSIPYTNVSPQAWQKEMFQGIREVRKPSTTVKKKDGTMYEKKGRLDTKPMSILASQRLFPNVNLAHGKTARATKPHDGKSDSLLMYEYCKRHF
jgi:hypothetical protein